jgi:hypothetical protein
MKAAIPIIAESRKLDDKVSFKTTVGIVGGSLLARWMVKVEPTQLHFKVGPEVVL